VFRVLIVDDSRALRALLVGILEAHGYASVEAETADDAFDLALADPPNAMIVDYLLPARSGADLVRDVRGAQSERLRSVPIIGLSSYRGSERPLLDAGASCFVAKPIRWSGLVKAVTSALEVYRSDAQRSVPPEA